MISPKFPLLCSFELVVALPLGKPGIDHRYLITKSPVKTSHSLISKGYLRNQYNGLSALPDHLVDQFHIDLSLAASGNTVKQNRAGCWLLPLCKNLFYCLFLRIT